ncbi:hypothetical protein [Flaviaesturariibacter aridisoli]|uniref:Uncharacterized protein n=1 Tax=Flaviaesturariibacter aridisoli TaxID=2545761 RepID=A0A4R4DWZ8_9BACT|nr:hypothetical protein [Flaviaesturariibacter aridisoli]TCZ67498.1 hypothetical protein E0486_15575 [Flaviaesturariibacter aridisoli]
MPYLLQFWIPFLVLGSAVVFCDRRWCMLRDLTQPSPQPYSWSRVQLAWWTVIILSSFIAIIWIGYVPAGSSARVYEAPALNGAAVVLLGISALTTVTARTLDANSPPIHHTLGGRGNGENFFLDILSDNMGVSISRFQTVVFNFVFGVWYVREVLAHLDHFKDPSFVMPDISQNNLILLGMSSATYAVMKVTENKEKQNKLEAAAAAGAAVGATVPDTAIDPEPAVG